MRDVLCDVRRGQVSRPEAQEVTTLSYADTDTQHFLLIHLGHQTRLEIYIVKVSISVYFNLIKSLVIIDNYLKVISYHVLRSSMSIEYILI